MKSVMVMMIAIVYEYMSIPVLELHVGDCAITTLKIWYINPSNNLPSVMLRFSETSNGVSQNFMQRDI